MAGMAFPLGDKYYVKCPRHSRELFAANYIQQNPNPIFVSVLEVNWIKNRYIMERGAEVYYWTDGLSGWIKKAYLELKRIRVAHDDIILKNIILCESGFKLIDFESMRFGDSHFKDFVCCNQLLKRIENNTGLIPRT